MHPARPTRRFAARPLTTFLLSAALAVVLGGVVYLVTFAVPLLVVGPQTDEHFGLLNACLFRALPQDRVGFAVAPDGKTAMSFSAERAVLCTDRPDAGQVSRTVELAGITTAAFDFKGTLWLATRPAQGQSTGLWRVDGEGAPQPLGELAPLALVGTAHGVVALDGAGKLSALAGDGQTLGVAALPAEPGADAQLSVSADGERVAVVARGGLFVFEAAKLLTVRAEGPCDVREAWWRPGGHRMILSCGPDGDFALYLDVDTGEREAAAPMRRVRSTLVARPGLYAQACEQLPCSAPAP
jgi:Lipoprotein LpqB beta-propeller domain